MAIKPEYRYSTTSAVIHVSLDKTLFEALKYYSNQSGLSVNEITRQAIHGHLKDTSAGGILGKGVSIVGRWNKKK